MEGSITVVVSDEDGARLPGATGTLFETKLGYEDTNFSGDDGVMRFGGLNPGTYDLTVALEGFETARRKGIKLGAGDELDESVHLRLAEISET